MLSSEALSARDIARLYPESITKSAARQLLLSRVRAGETGDNPAAHEGAPLKVRGTWLATLGVVAGAIPSYGAVR